TTKNLFGYCNWTEAIDISSDGKIFFCQNQNHEVEVWTEKGKLIATLEGHEKSIISSYLLTANY
ncbi:hypothetical protein, partial [Anaplasma marginale]|uniref:hypothetical protein n=1 Tax=Anaplasma marginale TaxID=770 RepID=UPI0005B4D931